MISAAVAYCVQYGAKIALQASGDPNLGHEGKILTADHGGPEVDEVPFYLSSRSEIALWQTWKVHKGQGQT